ncbi:MAG: hypothetical protein Q4P33_07135 [Flaviflexus sp.]|nr:hypothetical protein [Flaviflexus sp.]
MMKRVIAACLACALAGCSAEEELTGSDVIPILDTEQTEADRKIVKADIKLSEGIRDSSTHIAPTMASPGLGA